MSDQVVAIVPLSHVGASREALTTLGSGSVNKDWIALRAFLAQHSSSLSIDEDTGNVYAQTSSHWHLGHLRYQQLLAE